MKSSDNKSAVEKFKMEIRKAAIVVGAAAMVTTGVTGCESRGVESETQTQTTEMQTKKSFEDLTQEEKEDIKEVIQEKEILLSKILEECNKAYPGQAINQNNIEIIKIKDLSAWKKDGVYYIDENPDLYGHTKTKSATKNYVVVNTKNNKILCSVSQINGKVVESNLIKYYDKEGTGHNYINGIEFGSIIDNQYTAKDCLNGMKAMLKYKNNKEYYNSMEKYVEKEIIEIEEKELDR